jgi:esterase/lipase
VLGAIEAPTLVLHSPSDFAASQAASVAAFPFLGSAEKRYVTMDPRNNHHLLKDWDREQAKAEILTFLAPSLPNGATTSGH